MTSDERRETSSEWRVAGGEWRMTNHRRLTTNGQRPATNAGLWLVMCLLLALALAACGGGADTTQPPEILYGQDVCDECDMIISEEKFAAAYWTAAGEAGRLDGGGERLGL